MSSKAKAIQTLYRANRITKEGVRQAVEKGIITTEEYYIITGEAYAIEESEVVIPDVVESEELTEEPEEVISEATEIEE